MKIFLCYPREDVGFAARLISDLTAMGAVVSSYAPAGTPLAVSHHFIAEALLVVAALSPNALNSDLVRHQLETAAKCKKVIFPVISRACEIPAQFQAWNPIDFTRNYDSGLSALATRIESWSIVLATKPSEQQGPQPSLVGNVSEASPKSQEKKPEPAPTTAPANKTSRSERLAALQDKMRQSSEAVNKRAQGWESLFEFTGKDTPSSDQPVAFVSYSREDSAFAQQLAQDLKAAGARVWMDELDIRPGQKWAKAIEEALSRCSRLIVVLSPSSVNSSNVEAEINEALDGEKDIIPVIYRDCNIPFRLKTFQCADFRVNYDQALKKLLPSLKD